MTRQRQRQFIPRNFTRHLTFDREYYCDNYNRLFLYDPDRGLWLGDDSAVPLTEQILRNEYLQGDLGFSHHVNEVIRDLKSYCYRANEFPNPHYQLIPFNNVIFDLRVDQSLDYSHEYHFTSKLAVDYKADATCPTIDRIFNELVPPHRVIDLYQLLAYCFIRAYQNQVIFFLYGRGANGKGVYTRILQRVLGIHNTSSVTLTAMQKDKFAASGLYRKLANICPEIRYEELRNTDLIKKLSGGDMLTAERKYAHQFQFRNYAKLIFVTNSLPPTTDKTHGFYRRILLIEFPHVFDGSRMDRQLFSKIPQEEYEGLAFRCLQELKQMKEWDFAFVNQPQGNRVSDEYEKLSNPLDTFLEDHCVEDENVAIPKSEFRDRLIRWAKKHGHRVLNDKEIKTVMANKGIEGHKYTLSGARQNAWAGLKWKEDES
jgi:putative DNA primase/helicase